MCQGAELGGGGWERVVTNVQVVMSQYLGSLPTQFVSSRNCFVMNVGELGV